ncbi:hypothetical protein LU646_28880 [Pseudomonas alloputida]|uniref:hypothetical protein n=1 Tax=Pseudomonas alloputida TaxID=1940621 RepID=UPI001E35A621|nr:hypothetical protein [Pseudomonas alloputida]MCE1061859.1 hypothetical protein [Pseudomonas alloputida]
MGRTIDTCYMCSAIATSSEHVPPRCLFPEKKYLDETDDQRRDLITVPSCDKHNTQKSGDDEYLMYLFSMLPESSAYSRIIFQKAVRAARRKPQLSEAIFRNQIVINEVEAYEVDRQRVDTSIGFVARAIFFNETNLKWFAPIQVNSLIYNVPAEQDGIKIDREDILKNRAVFSENITRFLVGAKWSGANPGIFRYQYYFDGTSYLVMKFCFFDELVFEVVSHPDLWSLDFSV